MRRPAIQVSRGGEWGVGIRHRPGFGLIQFQLFYARLYLYYDPYRSRRACEKCGRRSHINDKGGGCRYHPLDGRYLCPVCFAGAESERRGYEESRKEQAMGRYTARITEVGRDGDQVFGVRFVVCSNTEIICRGEEDPTGNGWEDAAREAYQAATTVIQQRGYDYDSESSFHAYRGGPRRGLVEALWYSADEPEDGSVPDWSWDRIAGSGEADIPAELKAEVTKVEHDAIDAMSQALAEAQASQSAGEDV